MPPAALTSSEERLVDLLTEMGEVEADELESCVDALLEARDDGEDVELRDMLLQAGMVTPRLLESLLGADEDRPRDARSGRRVQLQDPAEEPGRDSDVARGRSGRRSRRSGRKARAPGVTPDPDYTTPDPDYKVDPDEPSSLPGDVETRRFDLDALAAASTKPEPKFPMPALIGGAVLAVLLGAGAFWAGVKDAKPPPPPPIPEDGPDDPQPDDPVPDDPFSVPETDEPDGPDPLEQVELAAVSLEEGQNYLGALELYRELDPKVREEHAAVIAKAENRLRRLEAHRISVDRILEGTRRLRQLRLVESKLAKLQSFQQEYADLVETPAGVLLDDAIFELKRRLTEMRGEMAGPDGGAVKVDPEPPERGERFAKLTAESQVRLGAVRKTLAEERRALDRQHQAQVAHAKQRSQAKPLDLTLLPGYSVKGATIESFTEHSVTLRSGDSRLTYAWDSLDPAVALRLRKLGVRQTQPEDSLALGRWCLERRNFEAARVAFGAAVMMDPRFKDQVPDVSKIARASRIFSGALKRDGTSIAVNYEFEGSGERQDWSWDAKKGKARVKGGAFEASGRGICLATFKDVGFRERVSVVATVGEVSAGATAVVGLTFGADTSREVTYLASIDRAGGEVLLARQVRGKTKVLDRKKGLGRSSKLRLILEAREDRMRVRVGSRIACKVDIDPRWDQVRVHIGTASNEGGSARLEQVLVKGTVRRSWLRKSFGEFDALLKGLLARAEGLRVFAVPAGDRPPDPPLSAEDAYGMRDVTHEVRADYTAGRRKADRKSPVHLLAASTSFGNALDKAPTFAAALYRRGRIFESLGRPGLALKDYEQAMQRCPRFYEAMAARGKLLAAHDRLQDALAHAEAAISIKADYAPAYAARALVSFRAGDLRKALGDLDLALALDPWNGEVRSLRNNVSNVLKGPPWERTYREETEHYVVKTDISARKCAEYARELELMRAYYTQRFGEPEEAGSKAMVLIFDTREGFHTYAELTTDDRVESLLGYYLPRYRQLLLYEDKDDATGQETRRVLYHEAFHQFIEGLIPDIPYWLNEGFADYYSASKIEGGDVTRRALTLDHRLRDLKRFLRRGGPVPFPRLMQETPSEFYSGPVASKYAQAWSMVHFFLQGAEKPIRKRFFVYVRTLLQGVGTRAAFESAWEGVDWKAVQRSWREHVKRL